MGSVCALYLSLHNEAALPFPSNQRHWSERQKWRREGGEKRELMGKCIQAAQSHSMSPVPQHHLHGWGVPCKCLVSPNYCHFLAFDWIWFIHLGKVIIFLREGASVLTPLSFISDCGCSPLNSRYVWVNLCIALVYHGTPLRLSIREWFFTAFWWTWGIGPWRNRGPHFTTSYLKWSGSNTTFRGCVNIWPQTQQDVLCIYECMPLPVSASERDG